MKVITHRGLDPSRPGFPAESTREAFINQLDRGYGLEFDIQFSKDGAMIAVHDADLGRITDGKDTRKICDLDSNELLSMSFNNYHLMTVSDLLREITERSTESFPKRISAIHLKADIQTPSNIDSLIKQLAKVSPENFILFDATAETARYIKEKNPKISLAASVSHPYDVKRYNAAVGGTLYTLDEFLMHRDLFDWAWLDEWDTCDENGGEKKLLIAETFARLRGTGVKIALVTPELHATSPGLLGGEAHQDAVPHETRWRNRMREILSLNPDIICTDYPDEVTKMMQGGRLSHITSP